MSPCVAEGVLGPSFIPEAPWICLDRRLPWGLLSSVRSTGVSGLSFFLGVAVVACNITFAVKRAIERNQKCSVVSVFHISVGQWFPDSPRRKCSLPDTSPRRLSGGEDVLYDSASGDFAVGAHQAALGQTAVRGQDRRSRCGQSSGPWARLDAV